jgi:selenocysteine-specific elongation factor
MHPPKFARLRLQEEVIALPGDRFVIRRHSPALTVGGGVVMDAFPPKRLNGKKTGIRLAALDGAPLERRIELLADEAAAGRSVSELVRLTGVPAAQMKAAIAKAGGVLLTADEKAVTRSWVESRRQALVAWLREFHKANPNAPGAPLAAARRGLDASLAALVLKDFTAIRIQGETVALTEHKAEFSAHEAAALEKLESAFRGGGFQPPGVAEVIAASGLEAKKARWLIEALVKSNRLIKLPDDLIFHADVITHIRSSLAQHKGRKFSVAEFKGWMNISRKFAIPLLEYLDQQRVTKRDGEVRMVI